MVTSMVRTRFRERMVVVHCEESETFSDASPVLSVKAAASVQMLLLMRVLCGREPSMVQMVQPCLYVCPAASDARTR